MKHWRTLRIGAHPWTVWLATPDEMLAKHPELPESRGIADARSNAIYIDESIPEAQRLEVLLHEFLHAVFPPHDYLKRQLRRGVAPIDVEEYLVNHLAAALMPVLQDAGLYPSKMPRAKRAPK